MEYENNLALFDAFRCAVNARGQLIACAEGQNLHTSIDEYLPRWEQFLRDWSVIRNLPTDPRLRMKVLWECILAAQTAPTDVDELAARLKEITGRRLLSLASKTLMLYSPHRLPPFDSYARQALGLGLLTTYAEFLEAWKAAYLKARGNVLWPAMTVIRPLAEAAESRFPGTPEPQTVRLMRLFDKWLWVTGRP